MNFWKNKRVLVTGGQGFLGHHVVERLAQHGANNLWIARHADYDLTRQTDVERLFAEHPADIVVHLAGLVGGILPNQERPADFFYQNLTMGTFMLHEAWRSGARKFIAAGAGCGYPQHAPSPLKETDFWAGFPQPESAPYSLAKRLLTIQAEAYQRQHGFPSIIGIPGNIYGPHDNYHLLDAHVIPALVRKFVEAADNGLPTVEVWGSGQAARDFVFAGDVAEGLILAAEKLETFEVINLSSGNETRIQTVVEMLIAATGFSGTVVWNDSRPNGQLHRCFDTSKARRLLGWETHTSLSEGLAKTVRWYRENQANARK